MTPDFSTADIAAALGRDSRYVRREIWSGRLPCARRIRRKGRVTYRVSLQELRDYLAAYDPERASAALEMLAA